MTLIMVLAVLTSTPNIDAHRFSLIQNEKPRHQFLVAEISDEALIESMTISELRTKYSRLIDERPSWVAPIVFASVSAVGLATGIVLLAIYPSVAFTAFSSYSLTAALVLIGGIAGLAVGITFGIIAIIKIITTAVQRPRYDMQLQLIEDRLRQNEANAPKVSLAAVKTLNFEVMRF